MLARMRGQSAALRSVGVEMKQVVLPQDVSREEFDRAFLAVNQDPAIRGILLFCPLPPQ